MIFRQVRRTLEREGLVRTNTILWAGVPEEWIGEYVHFTVVGTIAGQTVVMDQFEQYVGGGIGWIRVNRPEWSKPFVEKQDNNLISLKVKFW